MNSITLLSRINRTCKDKNMRQNSKENRSAEYDFLNLEAHKVSLSGNLDQCYHESGSL